jgi:hypothetical protein
MVSTFVRTFVRSCRSEKMARIASLECSFSCAISSYILALSELAKTRLEPRWLRLIRFAGPRRCNRRVGARAGTFTRVFPSSIIVGLTANIEQRPGRHLGLGIIVRSRRSGTRARTHARTRNCDLLGVRTNDAITGFEMHYRSACILTH